MSFQVRGSDHFPRVRFHGELEAPPGFDSLVTVGISLGVSGPAGIISSGDQVGIIGTYRDPSLLITGTIRDGTFRESERVNLWKHRWRDMAEGGQVVRLTHLLRLNPPDRRSSHLEWQPEGHRRL